MQLLNSAFKLQITSQIHVKYSLNHVGLSPFHIQCNGMYISIHFLNE